MPPEELVGGVLTMLSGNVTAWICLTALVVGLAILVSSLLRRGGAARCRRCHEVNRPFAHFCAHCGAPLE